LQTTIGTFTAKVKPSTQAITRGQPAVPSTSPISQTPTPTGRTIGCHRLDGTREAASCRQSGRGVWPSEAGRSDTLWQASKPLCFESRRREVP